MADDKPHRVSIGFNGGQILSARIAPAELTRLRGVLGSTGWHELPAEDGIVALDLSAVAYVLVDSEAQRVGFGS